MKPKTWVINTHTHTQSNNSWYDSPKSEWFLVRMNKNINDFKNYLANKNPNVFKNNLKQDKLLKEVYRLYILVTATSYQIKVIFILCKYRFVLPVGLFICTVNARAWNCELRTTSLLVEIDYSLERDLGRVVSTLKKSKLIHQHLASWFTDITFPVSYMQTCFFDISHTQSNFYIICICINISKDITE